MDGTPLQRLREYGQSPWLDALSRDLLHTGALARLVRNHGIRGVTTNPSVLAAAVGDGDGYADDLGMIVRAGETAPEAALRALAVADVRAACDVLRPVWDAAQGGDGHVSIEVDPRLAADAAGTLEQARELRALVDRPNLLVKIPATAAGVRAIEDATAVGIAVNATLIFSLARYDAVAEAYVRGLERLVEAGGDPRTVTSVASFFVSRVDVEVDRRLDALGGPAAALRGRLAIGNARLAYQHYRQVTGGRRWHELEARGAHRQRCLWASTATKDPAYSDVLYVEELIGAETVVTLPPATAVAFEDHGVVADKIERGVDEAARTFAEVRAAGVDLEDVWRTLEADGVRRFVRSHEAALATVAKRLVAAR